jgi:hypothetical protein
MEPVVYVVAVLAALFALSGVLPAYLRARARAARVRAFRENYDAFVEGDSLRRNWLTARRLEMQRDAEAVGQGVTYVAPPPAIGGGQYAPHQMFADLYNQQSYTDNVTGRFRLDALTTVEHTASNVARKRRAEVFNPGAWARRAFERLVRFPRYLLHQVGFAREVSDSRGTRIVTVVWSLCVGGATIGAFVLGLIQTLRAD